MLGVSDLYSNYEFGIYELFDLKKDISDLRALLSLSENGTKKEQWMNSQLSRKKVLSGSILFMNLITILALYTFI